MDKPFRIGVLGNVQAYRTEAEVFVPRDAVDPIAIVYQDGRGWHIELQGSNRTVELDALDDALSAARATLSEYPNRRGNDAPDGLSNAGYSLWLMEKSDGTAMGIQLRKPRPNEEL